MEQATGTALNTTEATTNTAESGDKVEITGSEHRQQQEKVNAILASGHYILITPDGLGLAVGVTPDGMFRALEIFRMTTFPSVIQAYVNETLAKILAKHTVEDKKEGDTK